MTRHAAAATRLNSVSGNESFVLHHPVGAGGVTFDSIISGDFTRPDCLLRTALTGDVNIGGLTSTGGSGAIIGILTGSGGVNLTGTIDLDHAIRGFRLRWQHRHGKHR